MAVFTSFNAFIASTNEQYIGNHTSKDYISLLWEHLGSSYYTSNPSEPSPTSGPVKDGWLNVDARSANTISHLTQVNSLSNVKRGDVVLFTYGQNGHAGFANQDYNGGNTISIYSQGYNGVNYVNLNSIDLTLLNYIGGWRYDAWEEIPPEPPVPEPDEEKKRFKWAIFTRKLNEKRRAL